MLLPVFFPFFFNISSIPIWHSVNVFIYFFLYMISNYHHIHILCIFFHISTIFCLQHLYPLFQIMYKHIFLVALVSSILLHHKLRPLLNLVHYLFFSSGFNTIVCLFLKTYLLTYLIYLIFSTFILIVIMFLLFLFYCNLFYILLKNINIANPLLILHNIYIDFLLDSL